MLKIFAPAKINLHLHVTGKRPDGYHLLDSLLSFADTGDVLTFSPSKKFEFKIEGPFANRLTGTDQSSLANSSNTVVRAAQLLAENFNRELDVSITLIKNLPPGSGIGGGSADAAACLWGLAQFWRLSPSDNDFKRISLKIGSDVWVCVKSLPVVMQGIGDIITEAPELPEIPTVLIWPDQHAATPDVYKNLSLPKFSQNLQFKKSYPSIQSLVTDLALHSSNDLNEAAQNLYPAISDALKALQDTNKCLFHRMTGSGSTVFGIFASEADASEAAEKVAATHPNWWIRPCWLNRIARY